MNPAETKAEDKDDLLAWLNALTDAVDVLLRHSERQLAHDSEAAFAAHETRTVVLRQTERDQAVELREQLRRVRSTHATRRDA